VSKVANFSLARRNAWGSNEVLASPKRQAIGGSKPGKVSITTTFPLTRNLSYQGPLRRYPSEKSAKPPFSRSACQGPEGLHDSAGPAHQESPAPMTEPPCGAAYWGRVNCAAKSSRGARISSTTAEPPTAFR